MIDINLIRNDRSLVEENLKKKFQESKISLLDEILEIDKKVRTLKTEGDKLRQDRNAISDEIGTLFKEKKTAEVKAMIETYNKQVDFVDFNSLDSIIQEL